MAINKTFLLNDIADDLNDYGSWDVADGGYLQRQLFKALDDVWKAHAWAFRITSTTFDTEAGNLGPYPSAGMPADFEELVVEEKLNKPFAYDKYGVPPPVPDGAQGERYPIYFDQTVSKIRFFADPGTGEKTLYYLLMLTDIDDALALFPDSQAFKKILIARTGHYALINTEEFASQAKTFWEQSEMLLTKEKNAKRRSATRPDTRTTRDISGNPGYYSLQAGNGGIE